MPIRYQHRLVGRRSLIFDLEHEWLGRQEMSDDGQVMEDRLVSGSSLYPDQSADVQTGNKGRQRVMSSFQRGLRDPGLACVQDQSVPYQK